MKDLVDDIISLKKKIDDKTYELDRLLSSEKTKNIVKDIFSSVLEVSPKTINVFSYLSYNSPSHCWFNIKVLGRNGIPVSWLTYSTDPSNLYDVSKMNEERMRIRANWLKGKNNF